jgi:hypothetical protein
VLVWVAEGWPHDHLHLFVLQVKLYICLGFSKETGVIYRKHFLNLNTTRKYF